MLFRSRRSSARLESELGKIPGVGEATLRKLLKTFGSLEGVQQAGRPELASVVGPAQAERIAGYFEAQVQRM